MNGAVSIELKILAFSVILGILQLMAQAHTATSVRGVKWNVSPRDQKMPELPPVPGRVGRIFHNFMETFPFFAVAVLLVQITNRNSTVSAIGAGLYFGARLIYIPLYVMGIPVVRSVVWLFSLLGILMVLAAFV